MTKGDMREHGTDTDLEALVINTDEDTDSGKQTITDVYRGLPCTTKWAKLEHMARTEPVKTLLDFIVPFPLTKVSLWVQLTHQSERLRKFQVYRLAPNSVTCAFMRYRLELTREDD